MALKEENSFRYWDTTALKCISIDAIKKGGPNYWEYKLYTYLIICVTLWLILQSLYLVPILLYFLCYYMYTGKKISIAHTWSSTVFKVNFLQCDFSQLITKHTDWLISKLHTFSTGTVKDQPKEIPWSFHPITCKFNPGWIWTHCFCCFTNLFNCFYESTLEQSSVCLNYWGWNICILKINTPSFHPF